MREAKTIEGESVPPIEENEVKPKENNSPSLVVLLLNQWFINVNRDEATPTMVEDVNKDDEVEKPIVEAPPPAIIEKLKSTNEEEKQQQRNHQQLTLKILILAEP
ncbi:hypothetical protein HAX54_024002 [Datura stramonium]|uniref:Uncharacterized protein n=1 Tax=Datura stramonium TaxID=4076 RepID=A0ABS8Y4P7_DATST|nr:hypothetical protein [Datura stramonium]